VRMAQVLRLRPGFCGLDVVFKEPEGLFLFRSKNIFKRRALDRRSLHYAPSEPRSG
jgi:hypothetical protein